MTTSELDTIAEQMLTERIVSLREYLARGEARLAQARQMRDFTIRKLRENGVSRKDVAELAGVSVAHVAAVTSKRR